MTRIPDETHPNPVPPDDERLFDLLVDDELEEARRRELLTGLDHRPGGWRRCALAFLEAQSWKRELGTLARKPLSRTPESTPAADETVGRVKGDQRRRRSPGWITTGLGMAASFLLAVGLTMLSRDLRRPAAPGLAPSGQLAGMTGSEFGSPGILTPRSPLGGSRRAPGQRGNVQVVGMAALDPDGVSRTARLPAVSQDRLDEDWLRNAPSAIPDGVAQAFEHAGHDVSRSRQLLPMRMKDGRQLMVPVDQLDIHYVDNPTYQ
ncbi:MAG: hypothetical protein NTW96_21220 [Planctomycetia bacterium]|nr:hypothetical protein [Planctomycetia bacterium]